MNADLLGRLDPVALGSYRAICATCADAWQGDRYEAERWLRTHAQVKHPPSILIYRDAAEPEAGR